MIESYTLDGIPFKVPVSAPDVEWYKITKSNRLANGDMTMDFIATKRKMTFSYDVMDQQELDTIKNLINLPKCFYALTYVEGGKRYSCTMYPGSLKYKRLRTGAVWYYKTITFSLIEK